MSTTPLKELPTASHRSIVDTALGFQPEDSLVILALDPRAAIIRADLDELVGHNPTEVFTSVAVSLAANDIRDVVVLYYTERTPRVLGPTDAHLTRALAGAGVGRLTTAIIDDMPEAKPPVSGRTSKATAAQRRAARQAFQEAKSDLAYYLRALDIVRAGREPSPRHVGGAARTLSSLALRDAIVVHMTGVTVPAPFEGEEPGLSDEFVATAMMTILDPVRGVSPGALAHLHETLLGHMVELLPARQSAPAHTLLALLAWWGGDPETAVERLAVALAADANYRLAHLLALTFNRAIEPGWRAHN